MTNHRAKEQLHNQDNGELRTRLWTLDNHGDSGAHRFPLGLRVMYVCTTGTFHRPWLKQFYVRLNPRSLLAAEKRPPLHPHLTRYGAASRCRHGNYSKRRCTAASAARNKVLDACTAGISASIYMPETWSYGDDMHLRCLFFPFFPCGCSVDK